jgi:hypothetical protein
LKWLVAFLDNRFPVKVVVTDATFQALNGRLGALESNLAGVQEHLKRLDANIQVHNQAMGFAAKPGGLLER